MREKIDIVTCPVKATLEYNLSDEDGALAFENATRATNFKCALWEIESYLRGIDKWGMPIDTTLSEGIEIIRNKFYEILEEYNINLC